MLTPVMCSLPLPLRRLGGELIAAFQYLKGGWGRAVSSPHLRTDVATALETRRGVGGSPVLGAMGRKFLPGEQPVPLSFQRVGLAGISCKAERSHYCVTLE